MAEEKVYIGEGRSAVVYLGYAEDGTRLAEKIFTGEGLSKIVLYLLTGSANPYTWSEAATRSAVARRHILQILSHYWFDDKLRLPKGYGYRWNEEYQAFEMRAELIEGSHAPLRNPVEPNDVDYLADLQQNIMIPLQQHLMQAGLDGMVWQAGWGNPVACNNFMLEKSDDGVLRWVWIDLESGVPAIFAMNVLKTFNYYLPKSIKHGCFLFDDVDTQELKQYCQKHQAAIMESASKETWDLLEESISELTEQQHLWKNQPRFQRSICYEQSQQRISDEQAHWFKQHMFLWYGFSLLNILKRVLPRIPALLYKVVQYICRIRYGHQIARAGKYIISSRFRWGVARWLVAKRIRSWRKRGYMEKDTAFRLRHDLHHDDSSAYITDFSVHVVIKPIADLVSFGLIPTLLWLSDDITSDGVMITFMVLAVGPIMRTIYTSSRMVQEYFRGQRLAWVALLVGLLPGFGNLAYPVQLLYRSREESGSLARFIVYDLCTAMGRAMPIWGGKDSGVEHWFNRACDQVVQFFMRSPKEQRGQK